VPSTTTTKTPNVEKISIIKELLFGEEVESLSLKLEKQALDYNNKVESLLKKIEDLEKRLLQSLDNVENEVNKNRLEKVSATQFKALGETIIKISKNS